MVCGMGDIITMFPIFEALRKNFPAAKITFITNKNNLDLSNLCVCCDTALDINFMRNILNNEKEGVLFFKKFDFVIHNTAFGCIYTNLQKSGVFYIDFSFRMSRHTAKDHNPMELAFQLMKPVKLGNIFSVPKVLLTKEDKVFAVNYLKKRDINVEQDLIITIQSGSGSEKKRWFFDRYIKIAKWLIDKYNAKILAISGPYDNSLGDVLKEKLCYPSVMSVKDLNLKQLSSIIRKTSFYLGNDCGIMHLSAAVGIPTIAIFGPTNPNYWAPRGSFHVQLSDNISYRNCNNEKSKKCKFQKCFDNIKINDVKNAVKYLLKNINAYKNSKYITIAKGIRIDKQGKDGLFLYKDINNLGILYFKRGGKYIKKLLRYIENNELLPELKKRFPEDVELLKLLMEKGVICLSFKKSNKNLLKTAKINHKFSNNIGGIVLAAPDYEIYSFDQDPPVKIKSIDNKKYDPRLTPCVSDDRDDTRKRCCPYDYCLYDA